MPNVQTTRTTTLAGTGSGPTLADLRAFLTEASDWSETSTVRLTASSNQRDGSSWRIELTETSTAATRSQR